MTGLPPLPESSEAIRNRLANFFPVMASYIPVLSAVDMLDAFDKEMHQRSIHFRALVLSTVALGATVSIIATRRKTIPTGTGCEVRCNKFAPAPTKDLVYTYLTEAKRANSLPDSVSPHESSVSGIVTCIHLFMAFEWLKDHDSSWQYLQMAITRAQKLKIDQWGEEVVAASDERRMFLSTRLRIFYLL